MNRLTLRPALGLYLISCGVGVLYAPLLAFAVQLPVVEAHWALLSPKLLSPRVEGQGLFSRQWVRPSSTVSSIPASRRLAEPAPPSRVVRTVGAGVPPATACAVDSTTALNRRKSRAAAHRADGSAPVGWPHPFRLLAVASYPCLINSFCNIIRALLSWDFDVFSLIDNCSAISRWLYPSIA